jgi:signal transduction histidine kinase
MRSLPAVSSPPSATSRPSGAELLRTIAAGTAASVGTEFLRSLVRHVAAALDADIAFAAEVEEGAWEQARVLASHGRGGVELAEGYGFAIAGTPCELAGGRDVVSIPSGTPAAFPADAFVARHGLEGYLAIVVRGTDGGRLGYLGVMSSRALDAGEDAIAVLSIFASRAGAEIERRRHEAALLAREREVAASRARMVSIADEERRQIGRNLHDGVQQRMIVLGHRIALAQRKLEQDPEQAAEHLRHAGEEARAAGAELRELARGLHPVALAERGLPAAIESLSSASSLCVELDICDEALPDDIAAAAYFLVAECLTNASRYGEACDVRITISRADGHLHMEVCDDGVGGADPARGTGLLGLADRLEVLGGELEVHSPPGEGTRIRARVPLAA